MLRHQVHQGVPFRQSQSLVSLVVRRAEEAGLSLQELNLAEYQAILPLLPRTCTRP
jgi:argininosuccinate lyase